MIKHALTLFIMGVFSHILLAGESDKHPLVAGSFSDKAIFIQAFMQQAPVNADTILKALAEGRMFYHKKTKQLGILSKQVEGYTWEPLTKDYTFETSRKQVDKKSYKKVRINNRLRALIKHQLAKRQLNDPSPAVRLQAVQILMKAQSQQDAIQIQQWLLHEENTQIANKLRVLDSILRLQLNTHILDRAAIETLSKSLEPIALNTLKNTLNQYPEDSQITQAISAIENKKSSYRIVENLFFGLSYGSVLVLAAIGLAITFGVMGVINMAHGELIMLGAYTTFVIQQLMPNFIGLSLWVALPAAFIVSASVGIMMERLVIQHLKGRPLETLLATFGISLLLQQTVRSLFSPLNRSVITPDWLSGVWVINPIFSLTLNRLAIIVFSLLLFVLLWFWMKRSRLGLRIRAVTQNRSMAEALGVNATKVDLMTFGLGAGIAGVAGVALSLLSNVGPNMGQGFIIDSFIVVVFGGVGNLLGTLVAGLSLGVANKWLEPFAGAVLAKIIVLVFIILFIQKKPKGLFPAKGRAQDMSQ